jgi:hypothetical protein
MSMIPFIVSKKNQEEETGVAISEHVLVLPDPSAENPAGFKLKAILGVLWDDNRTPAPSYHDPSELVWITVPGVTEDDDEEEEGEESALPSD